MSDFDFNKLLDVPFETVSITATSVPGVVILGVRDRGGDVAAVTLTLEAIQGLLSLIEGGYNASIAGDEYFKGMVMPVLADGPSSIN